MQPFRDFSLLHSPDSCVSPPALAPSVPQAIQAMLRRPRFVSASAFAPYLPMLLWTIEAIRPRLFAQVGLRDAVPFFAACEAMEALGEGAECYGLGLEGAPEGEAEAARAHAATYHPKLARFAEVPLPQAMDAMAPGAVDLLLLDPVEGEECEAEWARLLSPRGVVLVHGAGTRPVAREVLDRLGEGRPSLLMKDGEGLGFVLYGPERGERLSGLAQEPQGSHQGKLLNLFAWLGALTRAEWSAAVADRHAEALREALSDAEALRVAAEKADASLRSKIKTLRAAYDARTAKTFDLEARLFDAQTEGEAGKAEIERLKERAGQRRQDQARALAQRDAALALLRQRLEEQTRAEGVLKAHAARRDAELEALTLRLDGASEEASRLRRRLDALLTSTSWRMTGPVRTVVKRMRRR